MEELRHALHAAADDPPPTRIDLDQIIDGTRRYSRVQYRIGMVAGLTVMAAGAVLVPAVLSSPSGGHRGVGARDPGADACEPYSPGPDTSWAVVLPDPLVPSSSLGAPPDGPTADPSVPAASLVPDPTGQSVVYAPVTCDQAKNCPKLVATGGPQSTRPADHLAGTREECAVAVIRLSSAVAVAMRDALPGWGVTDSIDPGNQSIQWLVVRQAADASDDGYVASLGVANSGQTSDLSVAWSVGSPQEASGGCAKRQLQSSDTCRVTSSGDVLITSIQTRSGALRPTGSSPSANLPPVSGPDERLTSYVVTDIRRDGTKVTVTSRAPLTTGQLEAFAQSPGLTLFP
jgi:hypothetical protein